MAKGKALKWNLDVHEEQLDTEQNLSYIIKTKYLKIEQTYESNLVFKMFNCSKSTNLINFLHALHINLIFH